MKTKLPSGAARDLFLMAAIAYGKGQYAPAGTLFAAAMDAPDVADLLAELDPECAPDLKVTASEHPATDLSVVISMLEKSMQEQGRDTSLSASEDDEEDEDVDDEEDGGDEEDDSDEDNYAGLDSDDPNPDAPGENLVPSSVSSAVTGGGVKRLRGATSAFVHVDELAWVSKDGQKRPTSESSNAGGSKFVFVNAVSGSPAGIVRHK